MSNLLSRLLFWGYTFMLVSWLVQERVLKLPIEKRLLIKKGQNRQNRAKWSTLCPFISTLAFRNSPTNIRICQKPYFLFHHCYSYVNYQAWNPNSKEVFKLCCKKLSFLSSALSSLLRPLVQKSIFPLSLLVLLNLMATIDCSFIIQGRQNRGGGGQVPLPHFVKPPNPIWIRMGKYYAHQTIICHCEFLEYWNIKEVFGGFDNVFHTVFPHIRPSLK